MHDFEQIIATVVPIYLLLGIGAWVRQRKLLNAQADRTMLDLSVHLLLPCLILDNVVANQALRYPSNLFWSPLLGYLCAGLGVGLAAAISAYCRFMRPAQNRTFAFTAGIFNYGYIALPVVQTLYSHDTLGVLFMFNLGVETAFWTIGLVVLEGQPLFQDWRRALTTPVRALLLAVALNLLSADFGMRLDEASLSPLLWGLPVILLIRTIHLIGLCSIPVALLVIGATMFDFWKDFRTARGTLVMFWAVVVRNFLCPFFFILFACFLPVSAELKITLIVQAGMPAATFPLLLARHHGGDVTVALQVIFSTSAVALITLPLWMHLGLQAIHWH